MEMKKEYFPHLSNTEDNNMLESRKHLTHLPDPSYYDINNMHKEARDKFLQWYKIHKGEPFDMDRQLLELMWTYHSVHAGNLEKCSWISLVLITPSIPLITLPLHHYAWEHIVPNIYLRNSWYCTRRMQETTA